MAKAATTKTKAAAPAPAPETSTAPWAPADAPASDPPAEGSVDGSAATSEAAAPEGEKPSEERDQLTPTGENLPEQLTPGDSTGDNDDADGEGGNGGGDDSVANEGTADEAAANAPEGDTTSEERDQATPTGDNPSLKLVDEANRIDPETLIQAPPAESERPSEVTDQLTPVGQDVALLMDDQRKVDLERSAFPTELEKLKDRMGALTTEDQLELQGKIASFAEETLSSMERGSEAKEMAARMVDGSAVFGNRARRENHDETLPTKNGNVERNRRAKRAAERLNRENANRNKGAK